MISKVSMLDMTAEQWEDQRMQSLGGSDAGAVLGLNPYKSAYSLWAEKVGKLVPPDISEKEAVRLGHDLEEYVAKRFTEATGKKVRRENHFIYNSDYPFAHALPDRMVVGEKAGLECKTTSSWDVLQQCRAGEFPKTWYCQIMHYMMVTGAEVWYLAVLVFGHGFYWFEIKRNEAEIRALADVEREFWQHVEHNSPPPVDGSESTLETIKTIFPESADGAEIDLSAVDLAVQGYLSYDKQIKELEELRNEQAAIIQNFMQEAERGSCAHAKIRWKSQERKTFDRKKWEASHGQIPQEYMKVSQSRPFIVKQI